MKEEKIEGLLLQTIPYLGEQKILKVLTSSQGLLSFLAKKGTYQPFSIAEWVYIVKQKELLPLKEVTPTNHSLELRKDFATLSAAGSIGRAILHSQWPGKGGGLYALTTAYLQRLPLFSHPETLVSSFQLKLLLHDGLLAIQTQCSECSEKASSLHQGESLCNTHKTVNSFVFTESEWEVLNVLTFTRQFKDLQATLIEISLKEKIEQLFESFYRA